MQSRPLHYFITLLPVHHKLFNTVLNLGTAPKNWCIGLITPIFKSGVRNDPSNYRNKASNVASRRELGRVPLIINISKNILYCILYLLHKNEDTIVKQAFRTSLELHCNGKNNFYHNLMKISEYYDLPNFDPNNLSEAKIKHYIDTV